MTIDTGEFEKKYRTPAQRLLDRGANAADPKVGRVVDTEGEYIGQVAGSHVIPGQLEPGGPVNRARREYEGAMEDLPQEVQEKVAPRGFNHAARVIEKGVDRELHHGQPNNAPPKSR